MMEVQPRSILQRSSPSDTLRFRLRKMLFGHIRPIMLYSMLTNPSEMNLTYLHHYRYESRCHTASKSFVALRMTSLVVASSSGALLLCCHQKFYPPVSTGPDPGIGVISVRHNIVSS